MPDEGELYSTQCNVVFPLKSHNADLTNFIKKRCQTSFNRVFIVFECNITLDYNKHLLRTYNLAIMKPTAKE